MGVWIWLYLRVVLARGTPPLLKNFDPAAWNRGEDCVRREWGLKDEGRVLRVGMVFRMCTGGRVVNGSRL